MFNDVIEVTRWETFIDVELIVLVEDLCQLMLSVGQVIDVHLRKGNQNVVEVVVLEFLVKLKLHALD
jgi:hypothetical protein